MSSEQLSRFLDTDGKVKIWPTKQAHKEIVLEYLSSKFDASNTYTEKDVNEILKTWHTFTDWPLLRRELIDRGYMARDRGGYKYWKIKANKNGIQAETAHS
ncbi:DUF2087 domain-containing protein [Candidatus Saccharibacteria bacterium]|nr:DUF2087 domain-containing protein [Candidatus Saccharibacteria bacterium]